MMCGHASYLLIESQQATIFQFDEICYILDR
jgi:hypothetical protein